MENDLFDLRRERVDGTGDWIFNVPQFKEWYENFDRSGRILAIQGPPGSGKSVLAAHIIDWLSKSSNICVYSFCRHDDSDKHDITAIVRTLVYDLAESSERYNAWLQYFRHHHESTTDYSDSMRFIWQKLVINGLEKSKCPETVTWVVDGLDESNPDQRTELLSYLADLRYTDVNFKVIITNRYNEATDTQIRNIGGLVVELNAETNRTDIRTVIDHRVRNSELLSSAQNIEEVSSWLETNANGLFLWVRLVFEEVLRRQFPATDNGIMDCLKAHPTTLCKTYDRILRTLERTLTSDHLELSKEIFKWTITAARPLLLLELQKCIEPRFGQLTNLPLEIKRCCAGLAVVESGKAVKLLHWTVAEHGTRCASWYFVNQKNAHADLAMLSLNSIPPFKLVSESEDASVQSVLMSYGCRYWAHHVVSSSTEDTRIPKTILSFLNGARVLQWINYMFITGRHALLPKAVQRVHDWLKEGCSVIHSEIISKLNAITLLWLNDLQDGVIGLRCLPEKYEGEEVDGRRHGHGKCVYTIGDSYEGEWAEGKRHGQGVFCFVNGNRYNGGWRHDKQHGEGTWCFEDGASYTGTWREGEAQPGGLWVFPDGTSHIHVFGNNGLDQETLPDLRDVNYYGICTNTKHDRRGRFDETSDPRVWIYPNGARYVGDWKDGKRHGNGEWKCPCGSEYRGNYFEGQPHGFGEWKYKNGNIYRGDWENGRQSGYGELSFSTEEKYFGDWNNGDAGKGELIFPNGNRYKGVWRGGRLRGRAEITFGNDWLTRGKIF